MKPISLATKKKVIELFQEQKEIKEISQILTTNNDKISYGSVWNIINTYKTNPNFLQIEETSNQIVHSQVEPFSCESEFGPSPLSPTVPIPLVSLSH